MTPKDTTDPSEDASASSGGGSWKDDESDKIREYRKERGGKSRKHSRFYALRRPLSRKKKDG